MISKYHMNLKTHFYATPLIRSLIYLPLPRVRTCIIYIQYTTHGFPRRPTERTVQCTHTYIQTRDRSGVPKKI